MNNSHILCEQCPYFVCTRATTDVVLYFPVGHRTILRSWKLVLFGTERHPHRPYSTTSPSTTTTARVTLPPPPPYSRRGGRGGGRKSLFDLDLKKKLPSNVVVMGPCPKPAGVVRLFHRTLPPPPKPPGKNTVSLHPLLHSSFFFLSFLPESALVCIRSLSNLPFLFPSMYAWPHYAHC